MYSFTSEWAKRTAREKSARCGVSLPALETRQLVESPRAARPQEAGADFVSLKIALALCSPLSSTPLISFFNNDSPGNAKISSS